jgi:predicted ATPase
MSRFEQLHVRGFRRLYDLKLELRPLCVLVGANGSGKTSLLDVFALLAASASAILSDKISELGGMSAILTIDRARELSFELTMSVPPNKPLVYDVTLSARQDQRDLHRLTGRPPSGHARSAGGPKPRPPHGAGPHGVTRA